MRNSPPHLRIAAVAAVFILVLLSSFPAMALDPPHDGTNSIECNSCHVPYGFAPNPAPVNWVADTVCKGCHLEGGAATEVENHSSQAYGETMYCCTCHNPHQHQEGFPSYFMNDVIDTPYSDSRQLSFANATDFTHGAVGVYQPYDGICETCHTRTSHHRNDGSGPQQDHHTGEDCLECHTHVSGFQPSGGSCVDCHSITQPNGAGDYRRVIADELGTVGDFARLSHHFDGIVTNETCLVCHDMQMHQTLPDPQVLLSNVDTGGSIQFDGNQANLDPYCLACHDANGVNGDVTPFTDDVVVPNINDSWVGSTHSTTASLNCSGNGVTGCHWNGHGSDKSTLLAPENVAATPPLYAEQQEGFCFNCHDGGTASNIQNQFAKSSIHPVTINPLQHDPSEDPLNPLHPLPETDPAADRHVECADCHNPHAATGDNVGVNGAIKGSWGIDTNKNVLQQIFRILPVFHPVAQEREQC
jgi:hypothetical protein